MRKNLFTEIENISVFFEDKLRAFDVLQFILKNELANISKFNNIFKDFTHPTCNGSCKKKIFF